MDSDIGFLIPVAGLIVATISMICDLVGVFRGGAMESSGSPPSRRRHIVIVVLLVITWMALGFDYYDRHATKPQWTHRPLIQIRDKEFRAQTVPLDGYEYINCDFHEVTFEFQGIAPSRLTDSRIHLREGKNPITLRSQSPVVGHTLTIVSSLNKAAGIGNQDLQINPPLPEID